MGLVNAKEVAKAINLEKFGFMGTFVGWSLMQILNISALNKIYDRQKHLTDLEFINALLDEFEVNFEIPEEDLRRIPKTGAFITVSNHPLGGIDGILLLKILLEHRPDFKLMGNFLLHRIEPLKPYVMPVNPFDDRKEVKSSLSGFKTAISHIRDGHPLGIFPAGEVSTKKEGRLLVDRPWEEAAMKLAQKAEVPIVPIYFHGRNSKTFYRMAQMSDTLRTAKLPSELLTQKDRLIKVRIGNPISVEDQKEHTSLALFTQFLRRKTYMLANPFERKKLLDNIPKTLKFPKPPKKIGGPIPLEKMEAEIETLRKTDKRLLESKNYEVFLSKADAIPYILQEIGRLREITFREVGEGTNNSTDLDKFDSYYHHMFLWDNEAKKLRGFECEVLCYDIKPEVEDENARQVSLEELQKNSDVLSLHTPWTPLTDKMVNEEFINSSKPFWLINTARGKSVVTADLVKALKSGKILGAGLDVLEFEKSSFETLYDSENFPDSLKELFAMDNVIITPHIAGWTVESKIGLAEVIAEKIISFRQDRLKDLL